MEPGMTEQGYSYNEKGFITDLGKFQSEPRWAPFYWELMLDGFFDDEDEDGACIFHVRSEDVEAFPELAGVAQICIWVDGNGFVYTAAESEDDMEREPNPHILDDDCYVCTDCLMAIASDDCSGVESDERCEDIKAGLDAVESAGGGYFVSGDPEQDMEFSRRACDGCNNSLAGTRHHVVLLKMPGGAL